MSDYVLVRRRRILPRLLMLFMWFMAYNAIRLGFASGAGLQGIAAAIVCLGLVFLFTYPGKVAYVLGGLIGRAWYGS